MKAVLPSSVLVLCLIFSGSKAQTSDDTWAVKFSNAIISRYQPNINAMTGKGWEYSNTIITEGMEKVYNDVTDSVKYLNYIKTYIDAYVNSSGTISASLTSLDRVHPGISCLFLYEKTGLTKYKTAATTLRNLLVGPSSTYSKTSNGIFWHKLSGYNNIVMLDGIYMAHPFLAKYGSMFGDNAAIDTAVNQTLFVYSQLYDPTTHLIKHAWTSTPGSYPAWANSSTGNSASVWSRAMGWYMMAVVDILKYIPATHPKRSQLLTALSNLAIGVKNYQDATSGLWYQVVNRGTSLAGNYLETSGSAMFVYALKTASDSNWISSATYLPVAQKGWAGLKTQIDTYTDGKPRINNFAPAMSYQNNDAAYAAIASVDCPVSSGTQNPHGYAGILMAASVMEFPIYGVLPVNFLNIDARQDGDHVKVSWETGNETNVDYYVIEKSVNGVNFSTLNTTVSNESSKYQWTDTSINQTNIYYRVKEVSKNGISTYSKILLIKIQANNAFASVVVAPNPVKNDIINITLDKLNPGTYKLSVVTINGSLLVKGNLNITGTSPIVESLKLPGESKGIYYLLVEGKGYKATKQIFVN